jgi:hypothetical protein
VSTAEPKTGDPIVDIIPPNPPAPRTYAHARRWTTLTYNGQVVRRHDALLCLSDMWRAAGKPPGRRPRDWLALEETARLRRHLLDDPPGDDEAGPALEAARSGLFEVEADGLVACFRGRRHGPGGVWAHWQLALSYARHLSPGFHAWCNTAARATMERRGRRTPLDGEEFALLRRLLREFDRLHRRHDDADRHAADLTALLVSAQDLLLGRRRPFGPRARALIRAAVDREPYFGRCPCCCLVRVLAEGGRQVLAGAEFDHFFHCGLNRPEQGWLICESCHAELSKGGYLARSARLPEFRAFQLAVVNQRRGVATTPIPIRLASSA